MRSLYACAALLLILCGVVARLWRLDLTLYDFDEGVASIYALQLVERADFPLFGVRTSLGFYNPPGFIYLIAPAFLICKSPLFAVGLIQLAIVAAAAGLALYLHRARWRWGVLVFLFFAMLSPGPLLLCRRLWGHSLIPVFSCAAILLVLAVVRKPSQRWVWLLLPVVIATAQQVHFSGALLLVDAALVIWLMRVQPAWKWLLGGCVIATSTYVPYILFECRSGFADLKAVAATIAGRTSSAEHTALWRAALFSLSDFGGETALQQNYAKLLRYLPDFQFFRVLGAVLLVAMLALAVRQAPRITAGTNTKSLIIAALVWITVPLIIFSILRIVTVPAYWLIALPGPWILAGSLAEQLVARTANRRVTGLVLGTSILIGSLVCIRYLRLQNSWMLAADPNAVVYPSYKDQYEAIAMVCQDSAGRQVQLQQNGRADGIDYQLLYLITMMEGNGTRLRHEMKQAASLQHYLLNRATTPISPPAGWSAVRFGLMEVYIEPSANGRNDPPMLSFAPGQPAHTDPIITFFQRWSPSEHEVTKVR